MIAGVEVAVVLQHRAVSTGWRVNAKQMAAEVCFERDVEELDVDLPYIVADPFLKDVYEKAAILLAPDRAFRHHVAGLRVEESLLAGLLAPAGIRDLNCFLGGALDDWDELNPLGLHLVSEETIDGATVFLIGGVYGTQNVEIDVVPAQLLPTFHHAVEGTPTATVDPVGVVDFAGAVDTEADQKVVLLEELAPVVVEQDAVGLKGVLHFC